MSSSTHLIDTWDTIQTLGFEPDASVISEGGSGLSCDLGRFRISAGRMTNFFLRQIVQFSAVYRTPRSIGSIDFEMPIQVESLEQCAAWIAWHLNQQLPRQEKLLSTTKASFLLIGLQHQDTLPWVRERAAYAACPKCTVERSWMRVALNALKSKLNVEHADGDVAISFDGQVLAFSGPGWVVPVPAEGAPWPSRYQIPTENFSKFPSRLMSEQIHISVWKEHLTLGNRRYTGVTAIATKPPAVDLTHDSGDPKLDKQP